MTKNIQTLVVIIVLFSIKGEETDNPNKIENHSYEYYKNRRPEEITKTCELDEMKAYELAGDASSLSQTNEICPNLKEQCCGTDDFERIKKFWWRDRKRQQYHHRTILLTYKWILGYAKEFRKLAAKVIEDFEKKSEGQSDGNTEVRGKSEEKGGSDVVSNVNSNKYCYDSAQKVVNYDWGTREKSESFYADLTYRTEFIDNSRRGFYCMLCAVEGQKAIHTSWKLYSWLYSKRIYYNQEFCDMIVTHTETTSYALYKSFNHYLQNLVGTLTCVTTPQAEDKNGGGKGGNVDKNNGNGNLLDSNPPQLPLSKQKILDNPLNLQDWFWLEVCDFANGSDFLRFEKCEYYCQQWNIAKAIPNFDGDVIAQKKLVDYLKIYKQVFNTPRKNLFRDDQILMDKDLEQNFNKRDKSGIFYKTTSKVVDLAIYKSDFVWSSDSINPMEMAQDCTLEFEYEGDSINTIYVLLSLVVMVFFN